jgi:FAD/FMN-containing dehydrogenase
MDKESVAVVEKHIDLHNPLSPHPFYTLVETSGSHDQHDKEKLDKFLDHVMSRRLIGDGTVAPDISKRRALWGLRECISEAVVREGVAYKYDVSLPLSAMYDLVVDVRERCADVALCTVGYGHIGDGNLHLNVVEESHSTQVLDLLEPFVFDWTARHRGSISGEHGLGFKKSQYIHHTKSREAVHWMKHIKQLFDPNGILNPYKTLPNR